MIWKVEKMLIRKNLPLTIFFVGFNLLIPVWGRVSKRWLKNVTASKNLCIFSSQTFTNVILCLDRANNLKSNWRKTATSTTFLIMNWLYRRRLSSQDHLCTADQTNVIAQNCSCISNSNSVHSNKSSEASSWLQKLTVNFGKGHLKW